MPPNEKYLDGDVEEEPLSEASPWQSDTETCLRAYLCKTTRMRSSYLSSKDDMLREGEMRQFSLPL